MTPLRPSLAMLIVIALAACSPSSATGNRQAATAPAQLGTKPCRDANLHRAKCMIELILADLERSYGGIDGGGISEIKATSSTSYAVSLPQEERVDILTYQFALRPGSVAITGRTESTESY